METHILVFNLGITWLLLTFNVKKGTIEEEDEEEEITRVIVILHCITKYREYSISQYDTHEKRRLNHSGHAVVCRVNKHLN